MEIMVGILIFMMLSVMVTFAWIRRTDGKMVIEDGGDGVRRFSLELDRGPEELAVKKVIRFRVEHK